MGYKGGSDPASLAAASFSALVKNTCTVTALSESPRYLIRILEYLFFLLLINQFILTSTSMRFQSLLKIVSLLASIHASSADDALTISSIGCVAPSAFDSCLNAAVEDLTECNQEAEGNVDALTGCGIGNYMTQMQCYLESCWNKVGCSCHDCLY